MYLTDRDKYQLLFEISQKVRDTLDLDEIMDHLLDTVKTVVDYDAAGIFVLNQDLIYERHKHPTEMIAGVARRGFDVKPPEQDAMLTLGKGIIGYVIFSGTSLIVPDVSLDPRYIEGRNRTRSEITVPIIRNDRAIGALNLESDQLSAYDESDLEVLQFFADAAAISIEKAMLHRQLLEKKLLDKQLELARELQSRLFPDEPPHLSGYDIMGICLPAEEIGGDYYDFIQLPRGGMGIAVADVSGHGIPAAMMMTAFRGLLRMHTHGNLGPANIAHMINRQLPEFIGDSNFVTAVYAFLNPISDELTYVCCGHPLPLLIRSDGSVGDLRVHSPALGVFTSATCPTEKISLAPGDVIVLYTDGVVDLSDQGGTEFGVERLVTTIRQNKGQPAADLIQTIIRRTQQFSGSQSYFDDFTLVIIKRLQDG
jgi:sigma-B regulation protein RsbU (phosphoserine phosphatase)